MKDPEKTEGGRSAEGEGEKSKMTVVVKDEFLQGCNDISVQQICCSNMASSQTPIGFIQSFK